VRNVVIARIDLDSADKPLSTVKFVATFTLTASHANTQDATLSDGKGNDVLLPPACNTGSSGSTSRTCWCGARRARQYS